MKIEKLTNFNVRQAMFCCRDRGEAGERQLRTFEQWIEKGRLYGYVAYEGQEAVGFVIYYPIEKAPVEIEGQDLLAMQCMWVRPDVRGRGLGRMLIGRVREDAKRFGRKGITMEGFTFPESSGLSEFMPRDYFLSLGFGQLDQHRNSALLFMPISPDASPPRYSESEFSPLPGKERLRIDILNCDKCVGGIVNVNILRHVLPSYADDVEVFEHDQNIRKNVLDKGYHFGIFFDGKLEFHGAEITEEQVRDTMERYLAVRRSDKKTFHRTAPIEPAEGRR